MSVIQSVAKEKPPRRAACLLAERLDDLGVPQRRGEQTTPRRTGAARPVRRPRVDASSPERDVLEATLVQNLSGTRAATRWQTILESEVSVIRSVAAEKS